MRKIIILIIGLISVSTCFGQLGINTTLPLHPLHVDSKGNNPKDKVPNQEESKDDFVVTKEGNVGIGTITPTVRLDINGGAIKIIDTTDNTGKVLTSNGDGLAEIKNLPKIEPSVIGVFNKGTVDSNGTTAASFTNATITLKKGKWIVNWGMTLTVATSSSLWLTSYLSTSTNLREETGFRFIGHENVKSSIGGNLTNGYAFLSGSSLIEVTNNEVVINILIDNKNKWSFTSSSWENYLYALPFK